MLESSPPRLEIDSRHVQIDILSIIMFQLITILLFRLEQQMNCCQSITLIKLEAGCHGMMAHFCNHSILITIECLHDLAYMNDPLCILWSSCG